MLFSTLNPMTFSNLLLSNNSTISCVLPSSSTLKLSQTFLLCCYFCLHLHECLYSVYGSVNRLRQKFANLLYLIPFNMRYVQTKVFLYSPRPLVPIFRLWNVSFHFKVNSMKFYFSHKVFSYCRFLLWSKYFSHFIASLLMG